MHTGIQEAMDSMAVSAAIFAITDTPKCALQRGFALIVSPESHRSSKKKVMRYLFLRCSLNLLYAFNLLLHSVLA